MASILGGDNAEELSGDPGVVDDTINGQGGNDTIFGGAGDDTLNGGDDDDTIFGGDGDDTLTGGRGDDRIEGGDGDDFFAGGYYSGEGVNTLFGGNGNDRFTFETEYEFPYFDATNVVDGGDDDDTVTLRYRSGDQTVVADLTSGYTVDGTQLITFASIENLRVSTISSSQSVTLRGTDGANSLEGGDGDDLIEGRGGDDVLDGRHGVNTLRGGAGDDRLIDYRGTNNTLEGGADDDSYIGVGATSTVVELEGEGTDTIETSQTLFTLPANVEILRYATSGDAEAVSFGGNALDNLIEGSSLGDTLSGFGGKDTLKGLDGDDILIGGEGEDWLWGALGADDLRGEAGADYLFGGRGADRLNGGTGNDLLYGGAGADVFVIAPGDGINEIVDYEAGVDSLDVTAFGAMTRTEDATLEGHKRFTYADGTVIILRERSVQEDADAGDTSATAYGLSLGQVFYGELSAGDVDWIKVDLVKDQVISVVMREIGPEQQSGVNLSLVNPGGTTLDDEDNDFFAISSILYTAPITGTFYLRAAHDDAEATAKYSVTLKDAHFDNAEIASQLAQYFWDNVSERWRAFDVSQDNVITYDVSRLQAPVQAMAIEALNVWGSVTGLSFQQTVAGATASDIVFDDLEEGAEAEIYRNANTITRSTINIGPELPDPSSGGTSVNSYLFDTILHEIGHALGLGHAGNYNGDSTYSPTGASNHYVNDTRLGSIMSYIEMNENTAVDQAQGWRIGPSVADIMAIRALYPTLTPSANAGDTTYDLVGAGTIYATTGLPKSDEDAVITLYDTGGQDMFDASASTERLQAALKDGDGYVHVGSKLYLVTIAEGTIIEGFKGGSANDRIEGNAAANTLEGGGGADSMNGAAGKDRMLGGLGNDGIWGGLGSDQMDGGAGNDQMTGGAAGDVMLGGAGNDKIYGGSSADLLSGDVGADKMKGGGGRDYFFFDGAVATPTTFKKNGKVKKKGKPETDEILDFADNKDTLLLVESLWDNTALAKQGKVTAADVVEAFGSRNKKVTDLDFGDFTIRIKNPKKSKDDRKKGFDPDKLINDIRIIDDKKYERLVRSADRDPNDALDDFWVFDRLSGVPDGLF